MFMNAALYASLERKRTFMQSRGVKELRVEESRASLFDFSTSPLPDSSTILHQMLCMQAGS